MYEAQNVQIEGPDNHPLKEIIVRWDTDGSVRLIFRKRKIAITETYLRQIKPGAHIRVEATR